MRLKQAYAHLFDDNSLFTEERREELLDQLAAKTGKTREELLKMLNDM